MNKALPILLTAMLGGPIATAEPEVRVAQYQVGATLPDGLPFEVKPMAHQPGLKLDLLVVAEDLVGFKDDSLKVESFTGRDGADLGTSRRGRPTWKMASFPSVSEDGRYGRVGIEVTGDLLGKVEGSRLKGSVVVRTGSETLEGSGEVAAETVEIGPYRVSVAKGGGMFGGGGKGIRVQGDHGAIVSITAKAGDKELDSSGSSWSGDNKTFYFDGLESESCTVVLRYWKELKDVEVPIDVVIGTSPGA